MCRFTCPSMTNQLCFLLFWSRQQMGIRRLFFVPLDLGHLGPNSFMPTLQLHFCPFWITHMLRCQLISLFNRLHLSMSCWRICIFFTLRRWVTYIYVQKEPFHWKKSMASSPAHWDLSLYMIKDRLTILLYLYMLNYTKITCMRRISSKTIRNLHLNSEIVHTMIHEYETRLVRPRLLECWINEFEDV